MADGGEDGRVIVCGEVFPSRQAVIEAFRGVSEQRAREYLASVSAVMINSAELLPPTRAN